LRCEIKENHVVQPRSREGALDRHVRKIANSEIGTVGLHAQRIVTFVNVPIVYMSVKWWRTLHQNFSSPETVSSSMVTPLRIAAFGMLFLATSFVVRRWRLSLARLNAEFEAPDLPEASAPLNVED
jgi:hypothetical protein